MHPQSIVHALVHLNDGASLAHLGYPDMRVPISYALHYPERADVPVRAARPRASWARSTFEAPDLDAFPCLRLAREAGRGRRHRALRAQRRQRGRGARVPRRASSPFIGIPRGDRARRSRQLPAQPVRHFDDLYAADARGARAWPSEDVARVTALSWLLAFAGLRRCCRSCTSSATSSPPRRSGMRVERFSLFFPPTDRAQEGAARPSTRSASIPLGGYVKISGHEPGGGAPAGGRATAPTTASRSGSGSS